MFRETTTHWPIYSHAMHAVAERSPGRQVRPTKRSGDPDITKYCDWQPNNCSWHSPCPIVPDDAAVVLDVWLSKYKYFSQNFYVGQLKICVDQRTNCVVRWATQYFSLAAALPMLMQVYIDGLVQDCSNSIADALELLQSCAKRST